MDERERKRIEHEAKGDFVYANRRYPEMEIYLLTAEELDSLKIPSLEELPETA